MVALPLRRDLTSDPKRLIPASKTSRISYSWRAFLLRAMMFMGFDTVSLVPQRISHFALLSKKIPARSERKWRDVHVRARKIDFPARMRAVFSLVITDIYGAPIIKVVT